MLEGSRPPISSLAYDAGDYLPPQFYPRFPSSTPSHAPTSSESTTPDQTTPKARAMGISTDFTNDVSNKLKAMQELTEWFTDAYRFPWHEYANGDITHLFTEVGRPAFTLSTKALEFFKFITDAPLAGLDDDYGFSGSPSIFMSPGLSTSTRSSTRKSSVASSSKKTLSPTLSPAEPCSSAAKKRHHPELSDSISSATPSSKRARTFGPSSSLSFPMDIYGDSALQLPTMDDSMSTLGLLDDEPRSSDIMSRFSRYGLDYGMSGSLRSDMDLLSDPLSLLGGYSKPQYEPDMEQSKRPRNKRARELAGLYLQSPSGHGGAGDPLAGLMSGFARPSSDILHGNKSACSCGKHHPPKSPSPLGIPHSPTHSEALAQRFNEHQVRRKGLPVPWRHRQPAPEPVDGSFKNRAIAWFNLRSPFPEEHAEDVWKCYYEERCELEKHQDPDITFTSSDELTQQEYQQWMFREIIRSEPLRAMTSDPILFSGNKETAEALADGILYLTSRVSDPDQKEISTSDLEGELFVRIYPPHTLTALEIALVHYTKDYSCVIAWRLCPPSTEPLGTPSVNGKSTKWPNDILKGVGWKILFWGEAGTKPSKREPQPWPSDMPLTVDDVDTVATFLFGPAEATSEMAQRRAQAMKVFLASITIEVDMSAKHPNDRQVALCGSFNTFQWTLGGHLRFFPAKIRCICGVGSEKDQKYALKNQGHYVVL